MFIWHLRVAKWPNFKTSLVFELYWTNCCTLSLKKLGQNIQQETVSEWSFVGKFSFSFKMFIFILYSTLYWRWMSQFLFDIQREHWVMGLITYHNALMVSHAMYSQHYMLAADTQLIWCVLLSPQLIDMCLLFFENNPLTAFLFQTPRFLILSL